MYSSRKLHIAYPWPSQRIQVKHIDVTFISISTISAVYEDPCPHCNGTVTIPGHRRISLDLRVTPPHCLEVQNMQIVQVIRVPFATSPEYNQLPITDKCGGVTFARGRRDPFTIWSGPLTCPEIQYVKVIDLLGTICASKYYHPMPHKYSTVAVSRARALARGY